mgnify:CR=1 FL=1
MGIVTTEVIEVRAIEQPAARAASRCGAHLRCRCRRRRRHLRCTARALALKHVRPRAWVCVCARGRALALHAHAAAAAPPSSAAGICDCKPHAIARAVCHRELCATASHIKSMLWQQPTGVSCSSERPRSISKACTCLSERAWPHARVRTRALGRSHSVLLWQ